MPETAIVGETIPYSYDSVSKVHTFEFSAFNGIPDWMVKEVLHFDGNGGFVLDLTNQGSTCTYPFSKTASSVTIIAHGGTDKHRCVPSLEPGVENVMDMPISAITKPRNHETMEKGSVKAILKLPLDVAFDTATKILTFGFHKYHTQSLSLPDWSLKIGNHQAVQLKQDKTLDTVCAYPAKVINGQLVISILAQHTASNHALCIPSISKPLELRYDLPEKDNTGTEDIRVMVSAWLDSQH